MTLGQRIQQIRNDHYLSQEEFAEKLGTTRQTVSRWELDQTYPEISRIVLISKIFSVTTDSILKDGISTFDADMEKISCGVYRGPSTEIVETECFSLVLYCTPDKSVLGMKLYYGYDRKKKLAAVCERNIIEEKTEYAYSVKDSVPSIAVANSDRMAKQLNMRYDTEMKNNLRIIEKFSVDHSGTPLPTVKEAGIPKCLALWRMADSYFANQDRMYFYLCTGKTEFIFSIRFEDTDIYCGASYNIPFDLGLFGGSQYFRIRNYRDNSEKSCRFFCDFSAGPKDITIPTEECDPGRCIDTNGGMMWCVKGYNDNEIVLRGRGKEEYTYRRTDKRTERFAVN